MTVSRKSLISNRTIPVDPRVFNPQIALDPLDGKFDWEGMRLSPILDDQEDIKKAPGKRQAYGSRLLVRRFKKKLSKRPVNITAI